MAGRVGVDGGPARRSASQRSRKREGGSNSVVESQPSKLLVAGSSPVSRSSLRARTKADVAQLAERVLGKDEVTSSILVIGSSQAPAGAEMCGLGRTRRQGVRGRAALR